MTAVTGLSVLYYKSPPYKKTAPHHRCGLTYSKPYCIAGLPPSRLNISIPARLSKKLTAMKEFKAAIEALPAKISVIRKIEVGLNMNPGETWSIALYSEFDTLDDVKFYATHPEHVAAGKLIADVKENRACVDYEI